MLNVFLSSHNKIHDTHWTMCHGFYYDLGRETSSPRGTNSDRMALPSTKFWCLVFLLIHSLLAYLLSPTACIRRSLLHTRRFSGGVAWDVRGAVKKSYCFMRDVRGVVIASFGIAEVLFDLGADQIWCVLLFQEYHILYLLVSFYSIKLYI